MRAPLHPRPVSEPLTDPLHAPGPRQQHFTRPRPVQPFGEGCGAPTAGGLSDMLGCARPGAFVPRVSGGFAAYSESASPLHPSQSLNMAAPVTCASPLDPISDWCPLGMAIPSSVNNDVLQPHNSTFLGRPPQHNQLMRGHYGSGSALRSLGLQQSLPPPMFYVLGGDKQQMSMVSEDSVCLLNGVSQDSLHASTSQSFRSAQGSSSLSFANADLLMGQDASSPCRAQSLLSTPRSTSGALNLLHGSGLSLSSSPGVMGAASQPSVSPTLALSSVSSLQGNLYPAEPLGKIVGPTAQHDPLLSSQVLQSTASVSAILSQIGVATATESLDVTGGAEHHNPGQYTSNSSSMATGDNVSRLSTPGASWLNSTMTPANSCSHHIDPQPHSSCHSTLDQARDPIESFSAPRQRPPLLGGNDAIQQQRHYTKLAPVNTLDQANQLHHCTRPPTLSPADLSAISVVDNTSGHSSCAWNGDDDRYRSSTANTPSMHYPFVVRRGSVGPTEASSREPSSTASYERKLPSPSHGVPTGDPALQMLYPLYPMRDGRDLAIGSTNVTPSHFPSHAFHSASTEDTVRTYAATTVGQAGLTAPDWRDCGVAWAPPAHSMVWRGELRDGASALHVDVETIPTQGDLAACASGKQHGLVRVLDKKAEPGGIGNGGKRSAGSGKPRKQAEVRVACGVPYEQDPIPLELEKTQVILNFLAQAVREQELESIFSEFGRVECVRIMYDLASSRSKGYGFVYFESGQSAANAIVALNGFELYGRFIKVSYANQREVKNDEETEEKAQQETA